MFEVLKKFFAFCSLKDRKKFQKSLVLDVVAAFFSALKIPAIGVLMMAILGPGITITDIWVSLGLMLTSILGVCIVKYFATMLQTEAGYGTACFKRMEIAEHMRYLPMGYFTENSLGVITSVTTNVMEALADVGTRGVMIVTQGVIITLVFTIVVFLFDWRIGLVIIIGLGLYYLANKTLQLVAHDCSEKKIVSDIKVVECVLEYIKGIAEVKSYHLSGKYNVKLNNAIDVNVQANMGLELKVIPYMTLQTFIAKGIGVVIVFASIAFYIQGTMTLLNCIMMVVCSFMIMESLEVAGTNSALLRTIDTCVNKARAILDLQGIKTDGKDETPATYDIKADHISFAYEDKKILDDITLEIPQNTITAIVGPSGSGKTTLCHVLSRFWDVDEGLVTLGGMDVRDYSMDALMRNFSFVFQNVFLFKDTVANNIRFGDPHASMDEVLAAAKKARCDEFIRALPQGYDTVIGEGGKTLSGGERQRLSIARAIMKDAPIIVLDEATANVDQENEKELMEAIGELTRNKTIIMIAHRLRTVQQADQILVMDQGRIVQRGRHDELVAQDGIYKRFVESREMASGWKL